jgi:hypothetical protein
MNSHNMIAKQNSSAAYLMRHVCHLHRLSYVQHLQVSYKDVCTNRLIRLMYLLLMTFHSISEEIMEQEKYRKCTFTSSVCMSQYHHLPSLHATLPSPAQSACHTTITCPVCMPQYHHLPSLHATLPSHAQSACHSRITCPVCMPH